MAQTFANVEEQTQIMKIADRYIATTVINTTLICLLMLIGITIFISFIQEMSDLGTGNYNFLAATFYVFLELPNQIYTFFPMAMLVGVSLGLGLLANHSELTVLRASGMSLTKITWAVMKAALVFLVIFTLIGEWIGPLAVHAAENQKTMLTSRGQAMETSHGTWIRDGVNFLYIDSVLSHNHLQGISRYQFDKQRNLVTTSYAKSGTYQNEQWLMHDVVESQIKPDGIDTQHYPIANWHLTLNPKILRISAVDPEEMTMQQLYEYIHYLKKNALNATSYVLAFWQRLFKPLATLVMVWLAIPFVFGSFRRLTMGLRMMMGISLGFCFYILNEFFGPLTLVFQLPPLLGAIIPTFLFTITAYTLQRRVR